MTRFPCHSLEGAWSVARVRLGHLLVSRERDGLIGDPAGVGTMLAQRRAVPFHRCPSVPPFRLPRPRAPSVRALSTGTQPVALAGRP